MIRTVGGWTGKGLAHEAFFFDDDDAVRARCIPFVREGLDRDEAVVVVAGELVRGLLADELGDRVEELAVLQPAEESWLGGAGTLAAYQQSMEPLLEAGRPWRLIGEPIWLAAASDGSTWSRYEAVANEAFADYPYYSLCLHDRRRLTQGLVADQLRAHPMVWGGTEPVDNPEYVDTETFLRSVEPSWTPTPDLPPPLVIDDVRRALPDLEAAVAGSGAGREDEVLLAVYELVTNALRAAGSAEVRTWVVGPTEVWQVSDAGPGLHEASAGYRPPAGDLDGGRGLWLARSLADEAIIRPEGPGTAVRLHFGPRDGG